MVPNFVDNGADVRVLVQQDLADQALVGQQLLPQVEVRYVADALEGAGHLAPLRQQLLQPPRRRRSGCVC